MTERKVFVRYTNGPLNLNEDVKLIKKLEPWLIQQTGKRNIEWGYINGRRVGMYLSPEDAIIFRLTFSNDI